MLSKGGFTGRGEEVAGTRWEFPNKNLVRAWDKGKIDPRMKVRMTEEQIKAFVVEMGGVKREREEVAALTQPTNTISLGGDPFREDEIYKQVVGREEAVGLAITPLVLVGICILALWYFLLGHIRKE